MIINKFIVICLLLILKSKLKLFLNLDYLGVKMFVFIRGVLLYFF